MIRHWNRHLRDGARPAVRRGCSARGSINAIGASMSGTVLVVVLITKFMDGAWIAILAMVVLFFAHARHQAALRPGRRGARLDPEERRSCCRPGCTRSCWSPSCTSRRCGRWPTRGPPGRPCSRRSPSTSTADDTSALQDEWDRARHPGAAEDPRLAVPRDHPPDRRLRQVDPQRQPARRRRRLHPRVRPRPLVGAGAAQPERAAAQGAAAVHPRRHGRQRALAAALVRGPGGPLRRPGPRLDPPRPA